MEMGGAIDRDAALRLLGGLEGGGLPAADGRFIAERLDPVLVHFVVRYLRESYPASHPAATAVLERLVKLTAAYPGIVAQSKQGEEDPVTSWFESEHSFAEFRGRGRNRRRSYVRLLGFEYG